MKKILLLLILLVGCNKASNNNDYLKMCGAATFSCNPTSEIVVNSSSGFVTAGSISNITTVLISLEADNNTESKEFLDKNAITFARQLNLYSPKKANSFDMNFVVIGLLQVTYVSDEGTTHVRDFLIENGNTFRDALYPEVYYQSSIPLTPKSF